MSTSYLVNKYARKTPNNYSKIEKKSLIYKRNLFFINLLCFALAGYFFVRHNNFCEPGGNLFTIFLYNKTNYFN